MILRMGIFCDTMLTIPDMVAVVGEDPVVYQFSTQNNCEALTLSLQDAEVYDWLSFEVDNNAQTATITVAP